MGAWGSGLYENDDALDERGELRKHIELERSPTHLAVGVGLRLWLGDLGSDMPSGDFLALLERRRAWVDALPPPARERFRVLEAHAREMLEKEGSRRFRLEGDERIPQHAEVEALTGGKLSRPRNDELLTLPGAPEVVRTFAEHVMARLDSETRRLGADPESLVNLYELSGPYGSLGLLLELRTLGFKPPAERVAPWRAQFEEADRNTTEEREFWDDYAGRVRRAFELLA